MPAVDEDIRSEVLAEARELVAMLGEQLVELERRPNDPDLLNAIFRGFHTVKSGADFIQLPMLAELCHGVEDVFAELRSGQHELDARLLDVSLAALDGMQVMLDEVGAGGTPTAAGPALRNDLESLLDGSASATLRGHEFEALLDQLHGSGQPATSVARPPPPLATQALPEPTRHPLVALRGGIGAESVAGVGSGLRLRLPRTLAIAPMLMATLGPRLYAIPLDQVREVAALRPRDVELGGERLYWRHRGERLPLIDLSCWIDPPEADADGDRHVAVVQLSARHAALVVHRLLGCEGVVVEPLGAMLRSLAGFAGVTVTGDGRIALVLDIDSLARAHDSGLAAGEGSWI